MNEKGQSFSVFKILQGAIVAMMMLGIIYGVINTLRQEQPGSDLFTVTTELLSSAYAARGTGQTFTREANLEQQSFSTEAVKNHAGVGVKVVFYCDKPYCLEPGTDEYNDGCEYSEGGQGCKEIGFKSGAQIPICVTCPSECQVFFGEHECGQK